MFDSNIPSHNFSCEDRWALSFCQDRLVLPKASITSKGTPYHGALIDYTAESMYLFQEDMWWTTIFIK